MKDVPEILATVSGQMGEWDSRRCTPTVEVTIFVAEITEELWHVRPLRLEAYEALGSSPSYHAQSFYSRGFPIRFASISVGYKIVGRKTEGKNGSSFAYVNGPVLSTNENCAETLFKKNEITEQQRKDYH